MRSRSITSSISKNSRLVNDFLLGFIRPSFIHLLTDAWVVFIHFTKWTFVINNILQLHNSLFIAKKLCCKRSISILMSFLMILDTSLFSLIVSSIELMSKLANYGSLDNSSMIWPTHRKSWIWNVNCFRLSIVVIFLFQWYNISANGC